MGKIRLSYTAISTYQQCSLKYKFKYVDRLPAKPSPYLSFGSSIHAALEYFYKNKGGLLKGLKLNWQRGGYESIEQEKEFLVKGEEILKSFYKEHFDPLKMPIALEQRFSVSLGCVELSGVIDRVDALDRGYEVIDYKTSKRLPSPKKLENDLQLPIYAMAVEEIYGQLPEKLSFYYLVPNKVISLSKTGAEIDKTRQIVLKIADYINAGRFVPYKNYLCPWCDYQDICTSYFI